MASNLKTNTFIPSSGEECGRETKQLTPVKPSQEHLSASDNSDLPADNNSNYPADSEVVHIGEKGSKSNVHIDNSLLAQAAIVTAASGVNGNEDCETAPPERASTPVPSSPGTMDTSSLRPQMAITPISSAITRDEDPGELKLKFDATTSNLSAASSTSNSTTTPEQLPIPQMASTPIHPLAVGRAKCPTRSKSESNRGAPSRGLALASSTSTSAPAIAASVSRPQSLAVIPPTAPGTAGQSVLGDDVTGSDLINTSFTTTHESQTDLDLYDQLQVPIIGYETMEERSRFTVFKLRVHKSADEAWHIFRRYSDFVRLNDVLKQVFPHFRLSLPPKKWFGDNYERWFLDERLQGLQAFLNNIISHRDVCNSGLVRQFLCVDDPPGAHDSLEESRAVCELLEDQVYTLRHDVATRDARINLLEEELSLYKAEVENIRRALRVERALNTHRRQSPSSQRSEGSITEHDEACSEVEADQGRHNKPSASSSVMTSPECPSTSSWDAAPENLKPSRHPDTKVTSAAAPPAVVTSAVTAPTSSVTSLTVETGTTSIAATGVPGVVAMQRNISEKTVPEIRSDTPDVTSVHMNGIGAVGVTSSDDLCSTTVP